MGSSRGKCTLSKLFYHCILTALTVFWNDFAWPRNPRRVSGMVLNKMGFKQIVLACWCLHHSVWMTVLESLSKIFGWLYSCEYWPGTIWFWGQSSCFEFDKNYTAEILFNFLKMLHQHPLEREEKELTSFSKHTTLIFLFSLNSAKNLNNRLKHSHTKWNFKSEMKEGVFLAAGAVTSHSRANKIHLHLQRLLSRTSPVAPCKSPTDPLSQSWVFRDKERCHLRCPPPNPLAGE